MSSIRVAAERTIEAPPDVVYRRLADDRRHHPRFLPPAFSDFAVEAGGVGAGTVVRFRLTAGGRTREVRARVEEPEPGRVLMETDGTTGAVTTFTVEPEGPRSRLRIETTRTGRPGLAGIVRRALPRSPAPAADLPGRAGEPRPLRARAGRRVARNDRSRVGGSGVAPAPRSIIPASGRSGHASAARGDRMGVPRVATEGRNAPIRAEADRAAP